MNHSLNPVQVIAVTGGKGGVGKTNVSVNLGIALCRIGRRVTLFDADLGLANVDVLLGLKPRKNLQDVLAGNASLADVMLQGPRGLRIVPAASGTQEMVNLGPREHAGIITAFSEVAHQMDVLLIDTAAGISSEVISFLIAAQEILVVVCNEPTSITDAYALIKVLNQRYGIARVRVLANMVRSAQEGSALFSKLSTVAERFLDVSLDYVGMIPFDEHVRRAVQRQRSVVDAYPTAAASQSFMDLARKVDGWPLPRVPRGHLEFFVERLVASNAATA
ncbi:MAG: MinD/ParA family protein [Gammaproteobacteria bacterium]|nr:MinD/ParA family protein [Gammaproteobacteria bacterium]